MSAQHTQGDWSMRGPSAPKQDTPAGGDYAIFDAEGQIIAETFARVVIGDAGVRPARANAARIVQCVNTHDELLEAAQAYRDAQDALDNLEYAGPNAERHEVLIRRRNAAREDMDAAIAKATRSAS